MKGACDAAREGGWTPQQALGLLVEVERVVVDNVRPWGPGAIWWQLTRGEPGSSITKPPSEEWQRASAAKAQRQRLEEEQRTQAPVDAAKAERFRKREADYGPFLRAMSRDELLDLADGGPAAITAGLRRWQPPGALPLYLWTWLLCRLEEKWEVSK